MLGSRARHSLCRSPGTLPAAATTTSATARERVDGADDRRLRQPRPVVRGAHTRSTSAFHSRTQRRDRLPDTRHSSCNQLTAAASSSIALRASAIDRNRVSLERIHLAHVDADELHIRVRESRVRHRREVGETRADRDDEIGVARQPIGGQRTRHADRAGRQWMIRRDRALAGLGFGNRDPGGFGETAKRRRCFAVEHAAAGHDQRRLDSIARPRPRVRSPPHRRADAAIVQTRVSKNASG